ncbi:hypothetical protein OG393_15950 [Streptomyces sp. NBC_01216]|uniref:hypothetical protein n=1 Tax=Streptomyces sp. NBC_01216 TaxID=2903778 RepID=UPI002E1029F7|nr:hypothetical protein OG393_15950 [Streptomyces sp. NBC_01216]
MDEADEVVPEAESPGSDDAPEGAPDAAGRIAAGSGSPLSDRRIPVLTLGAGLALMGLGIGFLGVRIRRR